MDTLALTDRDGVYGAVRFAKACMTAGVRPILGVDLASSRRGWWVISRPVLDRSTSRCGRSRCRLGRAVPDGIDTARAGSSRLTPARGGSYRDADRSLVAAGHLARRQQGRLGGAVPARLGDPPAWRARHRRSRPAQLIAEHLSGLGSATTTCSSCSARPRSWAGRRPCAATTWRAAVLRALAADHRPDQRAGRGRLASGRRVTVPARARTPPGWPGVAASSQSRASRASVVSPTPCATPTVPMRRPSTSSTPYAGWSRSTRATSTGPTPRASQVRQGDGRHRRRDLPAGRVRPARGRADCWPGPASVADRCAVDPRADLGLGEVHLPELDTAGRSTPTGDAAILRARCEAGIGRPLPPRPARGRRSSGSTTSWA